MATAADSLYIFDYLNDVWELLSEQDQGIFAETWKGYEQTYGDVWMQQFESDLANTITNLPLYNIKRWLQHTFDSTTQLNLAASFTSNQDFSQNIDLSSRYLVRLSMNGGGQVEIDLRGSTPITTTLTQIIAGLNTALGAKVASALSNNSLLKLTSTTTGPTSSFTLYPASDPALDASAIIFGLDPFLLPTTYPKFPYAFQLGDTDIVAIPTLQDKVHDDQITTLLTHGPDFSVQFGTGIISFAAVPPSSMWAKDTLCNFETPYNNFGYLIGLYQSNTPTYLKAVQGLWYAFWNGPTPENIKRSLYLIFGLPTASKAGAVAGLTPTTITLTYSDTSAETFAIPPTLVAVVALGQAVTQFQPLVSGINVYDKVNYPGFLRLEVGRPGVQQFLTQNATTGIAPDTDETMALTLLEQNTYLPQIQVGAFTSPTINMATVRSFLQNIQPKSRTYLLQILIGKFRDQLGLSDEGLTSHPTAKWSNGRPALGLDINFDATSKVGWNTNTMGNQDDWTDAEENPYSWVQLDDCVLSLGERTHIDVYQGITLIDSFDL